MSPRFLALVAGALTFLLAPTGPAAAEEPADGLWFPVQLPVDSFADSWGEARSGGRSHEGVDIMAAQMRQVYAAQSGEILKADGEDCATGVRCPSFYLAIAGDDGRGYFYVHLNNDTPGRPSGCDGTGGYAAAFSPRLAEELEARGTLKGVRVARGEHIGYVGSSGNAGCGSDQLHFEIWNDSDWAATGKSNPYPEVKAAYDAGRVWAAEGGAPSPVPHARDAGANRIATAVALSTVAFTSADTVVLASASSYADALPAGPLAAVVGAPLLLVPGEQAESSAALPDIVADEIRRLGADAALLVGGRAVLPESVVEALDDRGIDAARVSRIAGADRYETSTEIARYMAASGGASHSPLLARGAHPDPDRAWPDALAASALGAIETTPVLLTPGQQLPASVRQFLEREDVTQVRIVGGDAAVSDGVEAAIRSELRKPTVRFAGPTRYETALAVGEQALDAGASPSDLHIATGRNWPDALAAGPALAATGDLLILVDGAVPASPQSVYRWVRDRADQIDQVHAVGGPASITDEVLRRVASYAAWPRS